MSKPKHKTLEQISAIGSIRFRRGHLMVLGRCARCGVETVDLERWPTMQCMPEARPDSVKSRGGSVLFDEKDGASC